MKTKSLALLLTLFGFAMILAPRPAAAQEEEVSFQFFHDSLQPYGEWIEVGDYGLCWRPAGVTTDWAPYTDGYWSYTDAGWTWVSYEDFGGIVYHYGRWVQTDDAGWVWAPDTDWGPAWVSWRNNDDYVGWAPLPPECRWNQETGVSVWADSYYDIGPGCYHFCHVADFGAPFLAAVLLPPVQNIVIIRNTVNITNITFHQGGIFAGGPRFDVMAARVHRPIPALKLVRQSNIGGLAAFGQKPGLPSLQRGNTLFMTAPHVQPFPNSATLLATYKPAQTIAASHVGKGWNLVKSQAQRAEIQARFAQETKGLTPQSSPARPVSAGELKMIPEKANVSAASLAGMGKSRPVNPPKEVSPNASGVPEGTARAGGARQPVHSESITPGEPAGAVAAHRGPLPGQPVAGVPRNENVSREREVSPEPEAIRRRGEGGAAVSERPAAPERVAVPERVVRESSPEPVERHAQAPQIVERRQQAPEAVERRPQVQEVRPREVQAPRSIPQNNNPGVQKSVPQGGGGPQPQGTGKGRRDDNGQNSR